MFLGLHDLFPLIGLSSVSIIYLILWSGSWIVSSWIVSLQRKQNRYRHKSPPTCEDPICSLYVAGEAVESIDSVNNRATAK